jgi:methionine-rich copper-binding protein CopC
MENIMKIRILVLSMLMAVSGATLAHTRLEASNPKDKSQVAAPKTIELTFDESVKLTSVTLQQGDDKARPLKVPTPYGYSFAVPLPSLTPGDYVISWSVLSDDTHVSSGKIHFSVVASEQHSHQH